MQQTIIISKAEKKGYRRQRAFSFDGNNVNTSAATSWITFLFMFPNHGLLTVLWGIHLKTSFRHLLSNKNYVCGMKLQKYIFSSTLFQIHLFNHSFSSVHFQLGKASKKVIIITFWGRGSARVIYHFFLV